MEKLGEKIWWEREGWFIRKNQVVGFLLCFVTCLVFVLGALRHAGGAARGTSCPRTPASVTKDAWTRSAPREAGSPRLALSQSQARPLATQMLCAFSFASRDPGVCGSASSLRVCVLVCVRLLEENRTVVSDLHYGRRTRVACLTALCETLVL